MESFNSFILTPAVPYCRTVWHVFHDDTLEINLYNGVQP